LTTQAPATLAATRGSTFITPPSTSSSPELGSGKTSPAPLPCQGCKSDASTAPAVSFCSDCLHLLCAACNQAHARMHCFDGHRCLALDEMTSEQRAQLAPAVKSTPPPPTSADEAKVVRCYLVSATVSRRP